MKMLRPTVGLLMVFLAAVQAEPPHIGYCFPMGGQRGTSFEATIGGQYLMGDAQSYVSGEGVKVEVIDYFRQVDQRTFGRFTRNKNNLLAQIKEEKEQGKDTSRLEQRIEKLDEEIAMQEKMLAELRRKYSPAELKDLQKKQQFNPQIAEQIKVRITVAPNAPDGERELRVRTPQGLSNPIFFHVGTLAEVTEQEANDNHHAETLQEVTLPVLINGQIMPGDIDCFRFRALKGQQLVVDVSARKLIPYLADAVPGWFQAVVALYDEEGEEVAFSDAYKFNVDPVLFYDVPTHGIYTLQIKDSIYRGREDFIYRISVGELPFITSIFPLGARENEDVDIALVGKNLPQFRLKGRLPETGYTEIRQISVKNGAHRSNPMPFAINTLPEAFEKEPNDSADEPQQILMPLIVNGRIDEPGDRDVFCFPGRAGQIISIEVNARRLNSPLDSIIRLNGPGIDEPIINDDFVSKGASFLFLGSGLMTHHADSYLLCTLPQNGTYCLEIGDAQEKGGADYSYRLRISAALPDFSLRLEPSGITIAPGGTAVFTVHAVRRDGFDGQIKIDAKALPSGFEMSKAVIPEGEEGVRFTLTAPRDLKPMKVSPEITGMAIINGRPEVRTAVPVEDQMQAFLYRHLVPSQELILAPSKQPVPLSFEAQIPKQGWVDLPVGEEVKLSLKGQFSKGENAKVQLKLDNPPEGMLLVKGWIGKENPPKNKKEKGRQEAFVQGVAHGSIILKAEESLEPGTKGNLVIVAVVKRNGEEVSYPAPAIPFRVVKGK